MRRKTTLKLNCHNVRICTDLKFKTPLGDENPYLYLIWQVTIHLKFKTPLGDENKIALCYLYDGHKYLKFKTPLGDEN